MTFRNLRPSTPTTQSLKTIPKASHRGTHDSESPAFGRLVLEGFHEVKADLGHTVSSHRPGTWRLRQEDCLEFESNLDFSMKTVSTNSTRG